MENVADRVAALLGVLEGTATLSWEAAEMTAGSPLPEDYKQLINRTGAVVVDDWLCLYGPDRANRNADIGLLVEERVRAWEEFREAGIHLREEFFAEGSRLLAFASVEANYFFWHARRNVAPDRWGS